MTIYKTIVMTDAVPGHLLKCDTILWDGKYWIVPEWLEHKDTRKRQPERIILLDNLKHQVISPVVDHKFFLNEAIPSHVWSGQIQAQTSYQVIIRPEIFFEIPPTFH